MTAVAILRPIAFAAIRNPTTGEHMPKSRNADQLQKNQICCECGNLFQLMHSSIDPRMSRAKAWTYRTGIWWGKPAGHRRPAVIGVDVFRKRIGAVGVLVFERSVSAVRHDIDRLCKHLFCDDDPAYRRDYKVDTVLVIRSAEEWRSHSVRILRIAEEINARIGDGA